MIFQKKKKKPQQVEFKMHMSYASLYAKILSYFYIG